MTDTEHPLPWDSLPAAPGDNEFEPAEFMDEFEEVPRPINWDLLSPDDLEEAWRELDAWVDWLRHTYGLPATIIPPYWHRHPELLWELAALHTHWQGAYHPDQHASAPSNWHRDFADARERLRDWTAASGTRLDRDQPTRQTVWPGEMRSPSTTTAVLPSRDDDFTQFVVDDVRERHSTLERLREGLPLGSQGADQ